MRPSQTRRGSIADDVIAVKGAREHNLKNVSLNIPRGRLVTFTGLSGSGKSSLAFDTIYAEGQRRYVESLSAYARQFLEMMSKPDVDVIDGLSPAIAIEQKTASRNPRSTVATATEIYDYMRLLYARVGTAYSPATGRPIESMTASRMAETLDKLPEGTRYYLLAPVVRARKGELKAEIAALIKNGFRRAKIDGILYELENAPPLDRKRKHDLEAVTDRLAARPGITARIAESLENALKLSDGIAIAEMADVTNDDGSPKRTIFSSRFACPVSGFTIDEIEPRLFSFNAPQGACPECGGLGDIPSFEEEAVIPDPTLSLRRGAIAPWTRGGVVATWFLQTIESVVQAVGEKGDNVDIPWNELSPTLRDALMNGTNHPIPIEYAYAGDVHRLNRPFEGVLRILERRMRETDSSWRREELEKYRTPRPCDACRGYRLRPEALAVKIADMHIGEACELTIRDAAKWFADAEKSLPKQKREIASRAMREVLRRLDFLRDVGLDYLSLSRAAATLSGGESQRIRLASQIGSALTGVLYVLDEPSIGLHQRDNARLLDTLKRLRDLGNSVIVVEHDEEAIRAADHIVDIGPKAGVNGGEIIVSGSLKDVLAEKRSVTGRYLAGEQSIPIPARRRPLNPKRTLRIRGAKANNLRSVNATFPLGLLTCVTGVSGSGKSTLAIETLRRAAERRLGAGREIPGEHEALEGLERLDKIIDIDQSPIGRTPRSNPATYTGTFSPIRDWFAALPEARERGYAPGRFSFNVKGGRCEACRGDGLLKIEMHFLPDVYVKCEECRGGRYNAETLDVRFRGKSIADVLAMTVAEALDLFSAIPAVRAKLETLNRVGLGYVKIGQAATTLSGGEAQRVKLAKELSRRATGRTLYILDEPTTGLHFHDVAQLLSVLHELTDAGNSVVVIEHNLDVIKTADWIIDLGPEGGDGGGHVVVEGPPEDVARCERSHTGRFLAPILGEREGQAPRKRKTPTKLTSA